jgi:hypothetical protein
MKTKLVSKATSAIVLAAALAVPTLTTQAQSVISWNLDRYGTISGANQAGVVLAPNWNNSWPANPTVNLIDNTGAATTLDLSYGSYNTWSVNGNTGPTPGQDADGSYNRNLLNGYLNSGPAAWGPSITNSYVSLSQIPYSVYDIYVYFSSGAANLNGSVSDGSTTFYFSTLGSAEISGANALLTQTTDTIGSINPGADYAIFTGLTGASQKLTLNMLSGNDKWGGIAGFQVVAVPEPGTLALAALGGLGMLALRHRR